MPTPEQDIKCLRERIDEHDHHYYSEAKPVISDQEYDRLFKRLKDLEAAHPGLITPDSPTQRVGEKPLGGFAQVTHAVPMLSIDNTYNEQELRDFDARVARGLDGERYEYVVDPKIDGVSATLRYENGRFILGATRGNGRVGDDITANLRTVRSIPLKLRGRGWPDVLEVRGEVYWPRPDFLEHNKKRIQQGEEPFANPRNATAGALKSLDPREAAGRRLAFMSHGHGEIVGAEFKTAADVFKAIKSWGLPVSPHLKVMKNIDEVLAFVKEWDSRRAELDYEIDGLVIKVNNLGQREALGVTSRFPRWAAAYKYAPEQAESKIVNVDFQVGKLGTITPRAVMAPVQLSGTTVRHATLHNFDQVARLDVRIGDTVVVEKAGEIIPQVIRVVKEKRPQDAKEIRPPRKCPVCGGEVQQDEGGVYYRCINPACEAQLRERVKFFCGRGQMDIEGLGDIWIDRLVEKGMVASLADLYELERRENDLAALAVDGEFGIENTEALLAAIELARSRTLDVLDQVASRKKKAPENALLPLTQEDVRKLKLSFGTLESFLAADIRQIEATLGDEPETVRRTWSFLCPDEQESAVRSVWALIDKEVIPLKDIGKTTIERLVTEGLTARPADLFDLHRVRDKLVRLRLPRMFGKKNARSVVHALRASKKQPLARVLAAMNIRHVGAATAELIAVHPQFGDMEKIAGATEGDLQAVEGVGPEVAKSIHAFFHRAAGRKAWQDLRDAGVNMKQPKKEVLDDQPLAGKTIVVTGTLEKFSRSEIERLIKDLGGKAAGSVSKKTDFLICGEEAGSKLDKAKALGVTVLSEHNFLKLVGKV